MTKEQRTGGPDRALTIGVVTISFNQAEFLREAIDSVVMADGSRLRYVIVDPGSTDGSREIIESLRPKFAQVVFDRDDGAADGLNKGFEACDADVFAYINSDDRFSPGALDWAANYLEQNPDVDVLVGAVRIINERGRPGGRAHVPWGLTLQDYVDGTYSMVQQGTFIRSAWFRKVGGFNTANRTCWDGELMLDLMLAGARVKSVSRVLGEFRIHAASISGSGRLNEPYAKDQARLMAKARDAGYRPSALSAIRRMAFRFNPARRFAEWRARYE